MNNDILVSRFNGDLIWLEMRNIDHHLRGKKTKNNRINLKKQPRSVPEMIYRLP